MTPPYKTRPIPFSGAMVLALAEGRKTQTRRIIKHRHDWYVDERDDERLWPFFEGYVYGEPEPVEVRCPYGVPGDRLWVREPARLTAVDDGTLAVSGVREGAVVKIEYLADGARAWVPYPTRLAGLNVGRGLPNGCHREASRITITLTAVRVQRLHDISENDVLAEGLACLSKDNLRTWKYGIADRDGLPGTDDIGWPWSEWAADPREAYALLWDRVNGEGSWVANPWVWALTFERV